MSSQRPAVTRLSMADSTPSLWGRWERYLVLRSPKMEFGT
ncbi:uncharacterized protein CPUR_07838 [Claviceps purpurea 20.1]|uniref:Uncharacterized protein n=1 Tax=Claviceps purpurea (strain 20.1) TaxID=1111077 RepID=M1WBZ0_CLAP2|nr:uncharacterized protein CPUR_07838 [Claviceps purpurea 20.1]